MKKLKLILATFFLHRKIRKLKRTIEVNNLEAAHYVGIVYNATDPADYKLLKKFVAYFKNLGKKVMALGYIDDRDPKSHLNTRLEFRFFTKKELNWMLKPDGLEVNNFIEEKFDLLLDLGVDYCHPIKYICALSKADFKVGPQDKHSEMYYDMILDPGYNRTLENFIKNTEVYIKMVNRKNLPGGQGGSKLEEEYA